MSFEPERAVTWDIWRPRVQNSLSASLQSADVDDVLIIIHAISRMHTTRKQEINEIAARFVIEYREEGGHHIDYDKVSADSRKLLAHTKGVVDATHYGGKLETSYFRLASSPAGNVMANRILPCVREWENAHQWGHPVLRHYDTMGVWEAEKEANYFAAKVTGVPYAVMIFPKMLDSIIGCVAAPFVRKARPEK